jgi:protein-L-isoaspartate(D-aspartate) O-methyltransferase
LTTNRIEKMTEQFQKQYLVNYWKRDSMIQNERIISAFNAVEREHFVPTHMQEYTYEDHPLPIGQGQTISQPTTVMMMLDLLELEPYHNVLEVGAGSGYNAAILSKLVNYVYSIEIIPELAVQARKNLKLAGIKNV